MKKQHIALSLVAFMILSAGSLMTSGGNNHDDDDEHKHGHDLIPVMVEAI